MQKQISFRSSGRIALGFILMLGMVTPALTQPREVVEVSYYKIKGGCKAEWLALYKKNHLPILLDHQKAGLIQSVELYEIAFHQSDPAWDFQVVMRMKNWAALDEMSNREDETKKRIYPNKESFDKEENRRWELTERHWDEVIRPVPQD